MNIQDIISVILVLIVVVVAFMYTIHNLSNNFGGELAYNDTAKWRSMLNGTGCKWYQIGCQKLACVFDCEEINKNAGEKICVC